MVLILKVYKEKECAKQDRMICREKEKTGNSSGKNYA
jgi:hypothetical protein